MSKALRNFSGRELSEVISRRLAGTARGLGYWAAVDAGERRGKVVVKEVKVGSGEKDSEIEEDG